MTKKHFTEIAEILRQEREEYNIETENHDDSAYNPIDSVSRQLATVFKSINPRFDRQRFLEACGESTKGES